MRAGRAAALSVALGVLVLFGSAANARPAAIRFVQLASSTSNHNQVTSLAARFGAPSAARHLLALTVATGGSCDSAITGVDDDGGNTWTKASAVCLPDAFPNLEIWFAADADPASVVRANWIGRSHAMANLYEFAGVAATSPLDATGSGSGHGDLSGSGGPATPTASGDLAIGALCADVIQPITVTSAGFHNPAQLMAGGALTMRSGARGVGPAPVSYAGSWSTAMDWVAAIALFRGA